MGITYAVLKKDPNINVRLISSLSYDNLIKYDEIYLFKISKYLVPPAGMIKNYYQLPIKEYGNGFNNREQRPDFINTLYITPDFTCYNPILKLSINQPNHKLAWKLKAPKVPKQQHIRLYEQINEEFLRRDINTNNYNLIIHDDPNIILEDPSKLKIVDDLIKEKHHLYFIQPLDISLITNTNILERVITDSNFAFMRNNLFISQLNDMALWFIDYYIKHKCKITNITVLYNKGEKQTYYLRSMLMLNYYNNLTGYILRLRPHWDKEIFLTTPLAHYMYRFFYEKPYLMSFYEYVFYLGSKKLGVPKALMKTDDSNYEYIIEHYGVPDTILELENWLEQNLDCEEQIFIGGSSKYEKCRRKYNDKRRSRKAFGRGVNRISEECDTQ